MADFITKCPRCQVDLTMNTQLIGQLVKCPACSNQFFVTQPELSTPPRQYSVATSGEGKVNEKSTASLVLGIVSLIAWIIPLIGFPVCIVGLILGVRKKYTVGIVLNVIGLVCTVANSAIGAYMGANGKLF